MNKPTDAELTAIYRAANGEDTGKAQPLTTQRIFRAMRAAIDTWGQPSGAGEVDRADAVNLARNCLGTYNCTITKKGIRVLAEAVLSMDAALSTTQPAPQQEPAHPSCKPDMTVNGGALKLALNVLRRAGKTEVADELEKTAQPAPELVSDDVVKDAARYRWLRDGNDAKHGAAWHVAVNLYGFEWDAAIDTARKQGGA